MRDLPDLMKIEDKRFLAMHLNALQKKVKNLVSR